MHKSFIDSVCEIYDDFLRIRCNKHYSSLDVKEKLGELIGWLECGYHHGDISSCDDIIAMLDDVYEGDTTCDVSKFRECVKGVLV